MWAKVDDAFPDHPKVVAAGPLAGWLFVTGLCYCGKYLTDGFIPAAQVKRLADVDDPDGLAQRLVEVGLWEPVDGGFRVHDYLDWNPSAAKVKVEREANARRQAEWRERNRGDDGRFESNGVTNGVTDGVTNGVTNTTPSRTRPVPSSRTEEVPSEPAQAPPPEPLLVQKPTAPPNLPSPNGRRTAKQVASDRVYARRLALYEAYCRGVGIAVDSAASRHRRDRGFKELTPILEEAEVTLDAMEGCARYAKAAYAWKHGKATPWPAEVIEALPEWNEAGRPEAPAPTQKTERHDESWWNRGGQNKVVI